MIKRVFFSKKNYIPILVAFLCASCTNWYSFNFTHKLYSDERRVPVLYTKEAKAKTNIYVKNGVYYKKIGLYYAYEHANLLTKARKREYRDVIFCDDYLFPLAEDEVAWMMDGVPLEPKCQSSHMEILKYSEQNLKEWYSCAAKEDLLRVPKSTQIGNYSKEMYQSLSFDVRDNCVNSSLKIYYYPSMFIDSIGNTCIAVVESPFKIVIYLFKKMFPHVR